MPGLPLPGAGLAVQGAALDPPGVKAGGKGCIDTPVVRVDAAIKAAGIAQYLADLPVEGRLYARIIAAGKPRARIISVRYPSLPEGYFIIDSRDIPPGGKNGVLIINDDWPIFADTEVRFKGQTIALVVGPDRDVLDRLAVSAEIACQEREPAFSIPDSIERRGGPIHGADNLFSDFRLVRGDPDAAFRDARRVIEEDFHTGYQEHVYLEPQGCIGTWEDGRIVLHASTQCPFYVKKALVHALGCGPEDVRVIQAVTGGGFGGKEHYPDVLATAVAVAVRKLKRPIQLVLDRREDMQVTPKRHPSWITIRTALDADGGITAMEMDTRLNAGAYETCSTVVLQRAIFHATGVYDIPNVRVRGRACATNMVPSDAFRGFGAPQALFAMETHMGHVARRIAADPVAFKSRYFLKKGSGTVTNGHIFEDVLLPRMLDRILDVSGYREKTEAESGTAAAPRGNHARRVDSPAADTARITASPRPLRGIGISFFNHGCAFTGSGERDIIKGRVRLRKLPDGTVQALASAAEMGQGLLTTFRKVVAGILEIPMERVSYTEVDTDLVPDSGPTVASRSIMIVGYMLQEAAKKLKAGWKDGEEQEVEQVYSHPMNLAWDQARLSGDAYPAFGWGINAVEVSVDPLTFEASVENVWGIFDVGYPVDRLIMEGQGQGGMIQALGYGGLEKLEAAGGEFRQGTLADYMIPTSVDFPEAHVEFIDNPYPFGPYGAKGAGELMLEGAAPAFVAAVENAVGAEADRIPLTSEGIMDMARAALGVHP